MVLYGAEHLTERAQAYDLLERAARLHWGWDRLPELAREERGKPYFPGAPQYHFNLSHSGPFALCALSNRPVGVDIQVVRPDWSPKLVDRSCTPEERAWLAALGDRPEDFAALWACKESIGRRAVMACPTHPPEWRSRCPETGDRSARGRRIPWRGGGSGSTPAGAGGGRCAPGRSRRRRFGGCRCPEHCKSDLEGPPRQAEGPLFLRLKAAAKLPLLRRCRTTIDIGQKNKKDEG